MINRPLIATGAPSIPPAPAGCHRWICRYQVFHIIGNFHRHATGISPFASTAIAFVFGLTTAFTANPMACLRSRQCVPATETPSTSPPSHVDAMRNGTPDSAHSVDGQTDRHFHLYADIRRVSTRLPEIIPWKAMSRKCRCRTKVFSHIRLRKSRVRVIQCQAWQMPDLRQRFAATQFAPNSLAPAKLPPGHN